MPLAVALFNVLKVFAIWTIVVVVMLDVEMPMLEVLVVSVAVTGDCAIWEVVAMLEGAASVTGASTA